jgi:hypothetical protein
MCKIKIKFGKPHIWKSTNSNHEKKKKKKEKRSQPAP